MPILIFLIVGLVAGLLYVFLFWGKLDHWMRRHLEKKHGVKFVAGKQYYDVNNDRLLISLEVKGAKSPSQKGFIKFKYGLFLFFSAFWPLILWVVAVIYFKDALDPILSKTI